ncbi:MAG: hypothetical protein IJ329_00785 [Clostridia bacterium]|nr:hypothetical protein [Clostridia bacterium]
MKLIAHLLYLMILFLLEDYIRIKRVDLSREKKKAMLRHCRKYTKNLPKIPKAT